MSASFASLEELKRASGTELGTSSWFLIDQQHINLFAEATEDYQWIHVDPVRAVSGQFGTTIAHGFLTLSLLPRLLNDIFRVEGISVLNYGLNRVRFPAPVPVDSRVRVNARLARVEEVLGGVQTEIEVSIEREGTDKPVCVASLLARFYE
jgi:acyl dehydratase